MLKRCLFLRAAALVACVALLAGCSSGGSSGEKERVYGTPVDPSTFFAPPAEATKSKAVLIAECMSEKGAVLYGSDGCPATLRQKDILADGMPLVEYVECRDNPWACNRKSISRYPTWICRNRRISGSQSLGALAVFTGCD